MKLIGIFYLHKLIDRVLSSIFVPDNNSKLILAGNMVGWLIYMINVNNGN